MRFFSLSSLRGSAVVCLAFSFVFAFHACTDSTTPTGVLPSSDSTALVVNQGTFGLDNSSLSRINRRSDSVQSNWYSDVNFGRKLGATANDILIKGDTAFVSVTGSKTIEVINLSTGKLIETLLCKTSDSPWKLCLLRPDLAAASTTNGDAVQFFNPQTLTMGARVNTGPATQGICGNAQYCWVANSGYGDQRASEAGAGTISVVDVNTATPVYQLKADKNVTELCMSDDGTRVYAYYQELYSDTTALQGIIEYDVATKLELRRWKFVGMGFLNYYKGSVYVVGKLKKSDAAWSILSLNTLTSSPSIASAFQLPANLFPNGVSIQKSSGNFWISNAGDFSSKGVVTVYSATGAVLKNYTVGVAPGVVGFYR